MRRGPISRPIRVLAGLLGLFVLLLGGVGVVILEEPLAAGLLFAVVGGLFLVPAFRADSVMRVDTASVDRRARSCGAVGVAALLLSGGGLLIIKLTARYTTLAVLALSLMWFGGIVAVFFWAYYLAELRLRDEDQDRH